MSQEKRLRHRDPDSSLTPHSSLLTGARTQSADDHVVRTMSAPVASALLSTGRPGLTFRNWSDTFSCRPELYFEPEDVDQVRDIVLMAKANGKKVCVLSSSFN